MSKHNKEIMRRFIDEGWNRRNREAVFQLLKPEFRHYMPGLKEPVVGPTAYWDLITGFHQAFPDCRIDTDEVFCEGSRVCLLWTFTGIQKGEFGGIKPSRRKVSVSGVGVARVRRGKIEEVVSMYDNGGFLAMLEG